MDNMSCAAYHASDHPAGRKVICPSVLLPFFHDSAHTVAVDKHLMNVVRKAVQRRNSGQPLYAIAKQIQWKWPEMYGEDKFAVMFGDTLRIRGDWLQGSAWIEALVQAEITTAGTADSFLRAAHVFAPDVSTKLQRLRCISCCIGLPITVT